MGRRQSKSIWPVVAVSCVSVAAAAAVTTAAFVAYGDLLTAPPPYDPISDGYSPKRLAECKADDAARAARGQPAQLCFPDLVAR